MGNLGKGNESELRELGSVSEHPDSSDAVRPAEPGTSSIGNAAMQSTVVAANQDSQNAPAAVGETQSPASAGSVVDDGNRRVGDFVLLEVIGRGGMGVVYKARQLGINRIVALKMVLAGGSADQTTLDRFRAEAEAAGKLDHPHIVPVYQFGVHQGHPYLAMGLVEGVSLKDRLAEGPLPIREAAELVARIARAIDYAHQRGVVHRDIKPHNILMDERGQPRVTDFGLAKSLVDDSGMTATGQILGTPSFMPPEQARGEADRVTASADIYSLGATLYALLTGRPPFQGASVSETLLQVVHHEPIPPRRLQPSVSVDLETICLECLHKEPGRRYSSAAALADDLERFLEGRPIKVRPVGWIERTSRWCRRNPVVASLAAATVIALVGGTIASTVFWLRALSEARDALVQRDVALVANAKAAESLEKANRAENAARTAEGVAKNEATRANESARQAILAKDNAEQVSKFLVSLFQTSDPLGIRGSGLAKSTEEGAAVTAGELLHRGAERIEGELARQPLVRATLMTEIGAVYRSLGKYDLAEPLLKKGLEVRRQNHASPLEISASMYHVAWLLHDRGRYAEAETLFREAIAIQAKEPLGRGSSLLMATKFNLAWTLMDERKYVEAMSLFREVVEARRKQYGDSDRQTVLAKIGLVSAMLSSGKERDALLYSMKDFGQTDLVRAFWFYNEATRQRKARRFDEAEKSYKEVLKIARAHVPADHPGFALLYGDFAGLLFEKGDYVEAEKRAYESLKIATNSLGNHPKMADPLRDLASHVAQRGDFDEASHLLDRALLICDRFPVAEGSRVRAAIYRDQLRLFRSAADYEHAEATGRKAAAWGEGRWNEDFAVQDLFGEFAQTLREEGKLEEACDRWKLQVQHYEHRDFSAFIDAKLELADFLRDAGRYRDADVVREETHRLIDERVGKLGGDVGALADIGFRDLRGWKDDRFDGPRAYACEMYLRSLAPNGEGDRRATFWGQRLLAAARFAEAEQLFQKYFDKSTRDWGKNNVRTCGPASFLARALIAQQKYPEAEARLRSNLSVQRASHGDNDIAVSLAMCELGDCLAKMGRQDEAAALATESAQRAESSLGPQHVWLPDLLDKTGDVLEQCGRRADADRMFHRSFDLACGRLPANHPRLTETGLRFESFLESHERLTEAETVLSGLRARFRTSLPPNSWRTALVENRLGMLAAKQQRFAQSEQLLASTHGVLLQAFGLGDARVTESKRTLDRLRKTVNKPEPQTRP